MFSQKHLALQTVRLKAPQTWVSEPNQMWFVFPKRGSGQYCSRSATRRLGPGDVLVLNSTCDSQVHPNDGAEFVFAVFSVLPEHIFPLFSSSELGLLRNVEEGFKATRLHASATPLARECHRLLEETPPLGHLEHRSQLLRVVAAILDAEVRTVQPHLPGFVRAEDHLLQVLESVSADELMNSSVGELAGRFGWSKRHLNRMFHSYFGLSAAAMKMEMRLLRAVELLRDPDVKIISVAESCGFNYLGFFNTCFKKRFGVTPSQRRKTLIEGDAKLTRLGGPPDGHVCPLRSLGLACRWAGQPESEHPRDANGAETRNGRRLKLVIRAVPPATSAATTEIPVSLKKAASPVPQDAWQARVAYGAHTL